MEMEGLRILVAFDGSELAMEAVKYVATMMPVKKTEIVLFYVENKMSDPFWQSDKNIDFRFKSANICGDIAEQHKRINAAMDTACNILMEVGHTEGTIYKKVQPKKLGVVNDIVRESREGYHAVVLGRRGENKIKDMLLGSVPMRLLNKIQGIPIIIVGGMTHSNNVLVAFDGSKEVMRAIQSMTYLVGASDCRVSFCHILKDKGKADKEGVPWKECERKRLEPTISKAKQWLFDAGFSFNQVCCELINSESYDLSTNIVEKANKENYATIAIGRRGLSVYQEFVSKRVGEKIFHQAENLTVWVFG